MALTPLLKHTLKMKKEFNPPIRTYPFSLQSQNWLVPIQIGYLIVYHTVWNLFKYNKPVKQRRNRVVIHSQQRKDNYER